MNLRSIQGLTFERCLGPIIMGDGRVVEVADGGKGDDVWEHSSAKTVVSILKPVLLSVFWWMSRRIRESFSSTINHTALSEWVWMMRLPKKARTGVSARHISLGINPLLLRMNTRCDVAESLASVRHLLPVEHILNRVTDRGWHCAPEAFHCDCLSLFSFDLNHRFHTFQGITTVGSLHATRVIPWVSGR